MTEPVVFVEPGSVVKQVEWETVPDKYMPEITGRRRFTVVRPGSVVQDVVWEAVPERYNPAKSFPVRAEAEAYARETCGTTHQLLTFPEGVAQVVRLGQDWPEDEAGPQVGDAVHKVRYRVDLDRLPGVYADEPAVETGDLESARAAVPAGRSAWISQILSIGPRQLEVIGTAGRVDNEGGEG